MEFAWPKPSSSLFPLPQRPKLGCLGLDLLIPGQSGKPSVRNSLHSVDRAGDLTGDRRNDHADFAAFHQLIDAANGVGAFTTMLNSVPEASGTILVFTAVTMLAPLRRRTRG